MARRSRRRRNRRKRGNNNGAEICREDSMMPNSSQNHQVVQPPVIYHRAYEVAPQGFCSQDPYHPAANYYGHCYTGFHPQGGEWHGHQGFFAGNSQPFNFPVMQAGAASYAYYAPVVNGYEHAHYYYGNPYSHINRHINGGFAGVGGSMPQYFSYSHCQQPIPQYHQSAPRSSLAAADHQFLDPQQRR